MKTARPKENRPRIINPMMMITSEDWKRLPSYEETAEQSSEETKVMMKYFNPVGRGTWYVCAVDPDYGTFFGFVSLFGAESGMDEAGSFGIDEILQTKVSALGVDFGLERDRNFPAGKYSLKDLYEGKRP